MGHEVTVYDRLSTGTTQFLERPLGLNGAPRNPKLHLVKGDILDEALLQSSMVGHDAAFHLAANADVRGGVQRRRVDFEQNTVGTQNVLEAMHANRIRELVFTSSAVVYGEPKVFPTPEDYKGAQTSLYGASKLAAESAIEAYAHYDGARAQIFRFVSLMGERYTHGVVFDFVNKLRQNPHELEILGDGKQQKSYLYVNDAIQAMLRAHEAGHDLPEGEVQIYNLGHRETMEALVVADVVCDELGLEGVRYRFTGGKRGWPGDSPVVLLDTRKIEGIGWRPTLSVEAAIRRTVRYLQGHPELLDRRSPSKLAPPSSQVVAVEEPGRSRAPSRA